MAGRAGAAAPLCSERFGSGRARSCRAAADGSLRWESGARRWWGRPGAPAPLSRLLTVLLPQGFPESVSADYLPYQLWDSVQVGAGGGRAGGGARARPRPSPGPLPPGLCLQPLGLPGHPRGPAGHRGGKCGGLGFSGHGHLAGER